MNVEFVVCPVCRQKLAIQPYVGVGLSVVCGNGRCNTSLRILQRNPIKVEHIPIQHTFNPDHRPESYG